MVLSALLLPVTGSNWSDWEIVAVFVWASAETTWASIRSVCGRGRRHRPDRPDPAGRAVAALARVADTNVSPAGRTSLTCDPGRRVGAEVAHGDRVGDGVTDVRRRVADRLGDRQIGPLRRLVALALLLPATGSNWSEWEIVAVFVWASAETTWASIRSVCGRSWSPSRPSRPRWPRCSCPGSGPPTRTSARPAGHRSAGPPSPGRAEVAHRHREGDGVTDVRRRVTDRLGDRQIGPLRRLGRARAVVAGDRVELVGVGDRGGVRLGVGARRPGPRCAASAPWSWSPSPPPDPAGRAVAALARVRRHERQPGRQQIAAAGPPSPRSGPRSLTVTV